jgi:hypothetical protein
MKLAILLWAAALAAQARDIRFDGKNLLHAELFTDYRIDDHRVELRRGVLVLHLVDSGAPPVEIVTPSVSVQPFFAGDYRVEVNRFGQSVIVPHGGDLRIVAPAGTQWIAPGQKMIARGGPANPEFRIVDAVSRWQRLAARIASAVQMVSISGGASTDTGQTEESSSGGKSAAPAAKAESPKTAPPRPNDNAPRSTSPTSRGK